MADPFDRDPTVTYGRPEPVAPGVSRVTCANPSAMTFTGTRSYLVGETAIAVLDPGPEDPDHLAAIEAALGPGQHISHILVTHTHRDHCAGARALAARTGAPVMGYGAHGAGMTATMRALGASGADLGGGEGADEAFAPDRRLGDDEAVAGPDWRLRALHTPGHLSTHLCFALEGTGIVFTGDTVMGWATTLVSPPEGDMAALMASLRRLKSRPDRLYLPGHGHPVREPQAMLAYQISHRQARARQVLDALAERPGDPRSLTESIYADIDPALWPAARRNVLATLLWLAETGRVAAEGLPGPDTRFRLACGPADR